MIQGMSNEDEDVVSKVRAFADHAHGDQMRKYAPERYVVHLERVTEICRQYTSEVTVISAALLHDILEDTPVTREELSAFLSGLMPDEKASRTLKLVEELTDVFVRKDYPTTNRRTRRTWEAERLGRTSPPAQTIKYADIIDNVMDISRVETDFALVFMRECKQILRLATRGDPRLHDRAVRTVDGSLQDYFAKANIRSL